MTPLQQADSFCEYEELVPDIAWELKADRKLKDAIGGAWRKNKLISLT